MSGKTIDDIAGEYAVSIGKAFEAADLWAAAEVKRLAHEREENPSEETERDFREIVKYSLTIKECQIHFLEQMDKEVFENGYDHAEQWAQYETMRDAFQFVIES